jgi:hypothetical protein
MEWRLSNLASCDSESLSETGASWKHSDLIRNSLVILKMKAQEKTRGEFIQMAMKSSKNDNAEVKHASSII